ncbi:MAG TPA: GtrA family protein, partial [Polyangiaceae bacterium]
LRFARTLVVGAWASALDVAVVAVCVRGFELDPTVSRLIALVASGVLLFFGNRSFAFRAQAGSIARQARLFVATEVVGLFLNLAVFRLLATRLPALPPELDSQIANFLVFIVFCYPMRAFVVFRVPAPQRG